MPQSISGFFIDGIIFNPSFSVLWERIEWLNTPLVSFLNHTTPRLRQTCLFQNLVMLEIAEIGACSFLPGVQPLHALLEYSTSGRLRYCSFISFRCSAVKVITGRSASLSQHVPTQSSRTRYEGHAIINNAEAEPSGYQRK